MGWLKSIPIIGGAIEGIAGAVEANQERQRKKGLISQAYAVGKQRLGLRQQDTRESMSENLLSRGLGQGGGVRDTGPVEPGAPGSMLGVGGAHTLGEQQESDLRREQGIEQTSLLTQKNTDMSNLNAATNEAMIGSGIQGAATAVGLSGAMPPGTAGADLEGATPMTFGGSSVAPDTPYKGAAFGVDPINPLGRGAWAQPQDNSTFNINNPRNG